MLAQQSSISTHTPIEDALRPMLYHRDVKRCLPPLTVAITLPS